jgi:hypothetical protein
VLHLVVPVATLPTPRSKLCVGTQRYEHIVRNVATGKRGLEHDDRARFLVWWGIYDDRLSVGEGSSPPPTPSLPGPICIHTQLKEDAGFHDERS